MDLEEGAARIAAAWRCSHCPAELVGQELADGLRTLKLRHEPTCPVELGVLPQGPDLDRMLDRLREISSELDGVDLNVTVRMDDTD